MYVVAFVSRRGLKVTLEVLIQVLNQKLKALLPPVPKDGLSTPQGRGTAPIVVLVAGSG